MDSTVYISLIIVAGLIVFGIVVSRLNQLKKKKEHQKVMNDFDEFVIQNNLTIDKKEKLNKNMIGIDRLNLKLVFLDNSSTPQQFHLINLQELSACRMLQHENRANGHISTIFLKCIFKQKNKPDILLPFYNEMSDDLFKMMRLSKQAAHWEKSINIYRESAAVLAN